MLEIIDTFNTPLFLGVTVLSTILFFAVYNNSYQLSKLFKFGEIYSKLNEKNREEWDQRVTSLVHSALVSPVALYIYFSTFNSDPLFTFNMTMNVLVGVTSGYFIWDFWTCVIMKPKITGVAMIFHAILGLTATIYVVLPHARPLYIRFTCLNIISEISTIFLNLKSFEFHNDAKSKRHELYSLCFALSFILVRCVWMIPLILNCCYQSYLVLDSIPFDKVMVLYIESTICITLNLYWCRLLSKKLFEKFFGSKKKH
ncbi:hypothetical protein DLAC_03831 [Tieghemostelium lacteum]|uniref:TLC domain-containing protein n=1 Tax=Tieghemostelium lacteum TaxID=361077 RepID=A0A152A0V7_TIELA|nr:hypothetical protein DLAC_03831 [Tieghemostelium lacteum]|eukprot:KYQ99877.1 hypothetical protein DLAC_03831 [Tieghemostelium lacteum]